jgi:hypothetical protein
MAGGLPSRPVRPLLLTAVVLLGACKGGNNYASMAKEANSARADAGSAEAVAAPPGATLIGSGQNAPRDIQLDGDSIFWINEGGRSAPTKPGLYKIPKAGGPVVALMPEADLMAMAADATSVYWLAPRAGKVGKVGRAGGTPEVLAETHNIVRGMVADETDVYWAEDDGVFRVSKAGGKAATVCPANLPDHLAIDGTHVYWYSSLAGVVYRAPKKGGTPAKVHADDQHTLHTIFLEGPDLFVAFGSENKLVIQKVPKGGGKAATVTEGQETGVHFAADGSNVYWISEDNVFKVPRNGGTVTKVVAKLEHGREIALDDSSVFWLDRSGRVQKMPK